MKQFKNYKDIPAKYKWNLDFLLEGKTPEEYLIQILDNFKEEIKIKDSKYESSGTYLKALKLNDENTKKIFRFSNYLSNSLSKNVVDSKVTSLNQKFDYEFYKLNQKFGSEQSRFFKNADKIKKWIKLPEFNEYKYKLSKLLKTKKFQLSKKIQDFRIKQSRADISARNPFSLLTNSELQYGYATSSAGKKIKVSPSNLSHLMKHKDKLVRKTASIAYNQAFYQHRATLSNLLYQHKKSESVWASVKGFDSAIEMLTFDDQVNKDFLEKLFEVVQSGKDIFKKYKNNWKKFYKAKFNENPTKYDGGVELVKVKTEYDVDEAMKMVKESIKPFGPVYESVVKESFKENWVDFMPVKNKRQGAYSIGGTYGIDKKLILMNFDGTLNSVSTLAHEMGHSMHSYFADKNNNLRNSQYPIFLAEIASIFNELMLSDYLLKSTDDKKLKFMILDQNISTFSGTVLRQVEWANYEYDVYNAIDKGQPIGTYEALSKIYFKNMKKYAIKESKKFDPKSLTRAVSVPHFYYGFYVYKYAIGQLVASIFFQKYKQDGAKALEVYINSFLSKGGSDDPLAILKNAGIDLNDISTYNLGFKACQENIDKWVKLGKDIFKI